MLSETAIQAHCAAWLIALSSEYR